ncbi:MAG: phage tail assembly protein [Candidatus Aminicenantes bacterium]|nr:phage tail assembly protein [Candidatus Aminicenantes bacterium]NIM84447.1 phage tail assembly protein [Candidatus Aminicenantes bacterium]NIN23967.1 phage tail assembly protein [Candidatus Aminicenantes bacterium]NIN47681.1 phage tail assembly protein [Candidatus Aminicenantes bacterium]NIN90611.1 phage tail assembly protein [Candidatus Aminicenantes bacterium]
MVLQTEYEFTLPKGYVDEKGNMHKKGIMRLANASDEILPMKDPRVQSNPAYLAVIVLARVVTKLGEVNDVSPGVIEKLYIGDLTYLQELYRRVNGDGNLMLDVKCPHCGEHFEEAITAPGG